MNRNNTTQRTTVFFDGGCLLCSREIAHYQRLDSSRRLRWVDITQQPESMTAAGLSAGDAVARFHVLDRHGVWQTGAWGFLVMWRELPGYRWLARLISVTHSVSLLDVPYRWFARRRLSSRCGDACSLPQVRES